MSARDAVEEVDWRGCCEGLKSDDDAGAGDHTSGRIGEVGITITTLVDSEKGNAQKHAKTTRQLRVLLQGHATSHLR